MQIIYPHDSTEPWQHRTYNDTTTPSWQWVVICFIIENHKILQGREEASLFQFTLFHSFIYRNLFLRLQSCPPPLLDSTQWTLSWKPDEHTYQSTARTKQESNCTHNLEGIKELVRVTAHGSADGKADVDATERWYVGGLAGVVAGGTSHRFDASAHRLPVRSRVGLRVQTLDAVAACGCGVSSVPGDKRKAGENIKDDLRAGDGTFCHSHCCSFKCQHQH